MTVYPGETHCYWCHRKFHRGDRGLRATDDHIVPQCCGGTDTVRACLACNSVKGDMTPEQWQRFMSSVPRWWTMFTRSGPRGRELFDAKGL